MSLARDSNHNIHSVIYRWNPSTKVQVSQLCPLLFHWNSVNWICTELHWTVLPGGKFCFCSFTLLFHLFRVLSCFHKIFASPLCSLFSLWFLTPISCLRRTRLFPPLGHMTGSSSQLDHTTSWWWPTHLMVRPPPSAPPSTCGWMAASSPTRIFWSVFHAFYCPCETFTFHQHKSVCHYCNSVKLKKLTMWSDRIETPGPTPPCSLDPRPNQFTFNLMTVNISRWNFNDDWSRIFILQWHQNNQNKLTSKRQDVVIPQFIILWLKRKRSL